MSGILAFPPYYPSPEDDGLVAYYRGIADATPLGLLIYSRDWFNPSPALVEKLAQQIPNLIAWKDGPGGHPALSDDPPARRRPAALDRRRGRRHGAGLLLDGHPHLHFEHRERRAETFAASA